MPTGLAPALAFALALSPQGAPEPQLYPRIRLAEYMPALTDTGRTWEEAVEFVRRNGQDDLSWTPPQVEIRAGEDMSRTTVSVAFNWVWLTDGQGRRPVWFARMRAMDWTHSLERFADARTCPAIEASLRRLDALPAIDPKVPGLPDPNSPLDLDILGGGYLHDNTYVLRLRGTFAGDRYSQRVEVIGGSASALAPAVAETLARLMPCWTETPPPRA